MIAVLQRVNQARVTVGEETIAAIGTGMLVLVAVEKGDAETQAQRLAERLVSYRIFADEGDKMNLSVADIDGGLLLVPQFTLAADTHKGSRPSFTPAADPESGRRLFECLVAAARKLHPQVMTGCFGADMKVSLVNDGPFTFILTTRPR